MTLQEAIERLRKIPVRPKPDNALDMQAIIMAVKALEKQIPKKVVTIVSDEDVKLGAMTMKAGTKVFKCTNCNSYVSPSHKFCTKCGQALEL